MKCDRKLGFGTVTGLIARMIGVVLFLSVLAFAASGTAFAAQKTAKSVVRVWNHHVHDKKYTTKMYKQFNNNNKDVQIDYTSQVGGIYPNVLRMALLAGEPPDLFYPTGQALPDLIKQGHVIPINKTAPSEAALKAWMDRFPPGSFIEGLNVFDGKVYSFPLAGSESDIALFYSRRLFKNAGFNPDTPPRSWDDMRAYARKLTVPGSVYGIVSGGANLEVTLERAYAVPSGWPMRGQDFRTGRWVWNHPVLKGAIKLWLDLKADGSYLPGLETMDDETARRYFALEKAAMTFDGPWAVSGIPAYNSKADFDLSLPATRDGTYTGVTPSGSYAGDIRYVVSARTKDPAAVWKVIQFITSPEFQDGYVKGGYGISIFPESNRPENFTVPQMAKVAEYARIQRKIAPVVADPVAWNRVWQLLEPVHPDSYEIYMGIWTGRETPAALDRYEKRFNDAIDKAIARAREEGLNFSRKDITFPDWDPSKDYMPKAKK